MRHSPRAWWVALGIILLGHAQLSFAQGTCESWAGKLVSVQGQVELKRARGTNWMVSGADSLYCPGDSLRVGADSRATVLLPNETLVRLKQHSTLTFPAPADTGFSLVDLVEGIGYFLSRVPRRLEIRTPFVNGAVEGTEFLVQAAPGQSRILVFEGVVSAQNPYGRLLLRSGEGALAGPGEAPRKVLIAEPRDAVKWALYYPPVADFPAADDPAEVREVRARFGGGDSAAALEVLERVPRRRRGAWFHTLRASLLLYVGQVEPARKDLARALALDPEEGTAIALQSIIALVLDRPEEARLLAAKGARLAPANAAPWVALSYVDQARFDLDRAWESARTATELAPDNALAWARSAELDLARGDFDRALSAAQRSIELDPRLARTRTTLGFAQLLRFDARGAAASFERAIELDQADPLPRLGLGIARIRQGRLGPGRRDIEIAVALDPARSILRSYLGKAYYDERRDGLAARQYGLAKDLDPSDPTPWFYDAIREQTANRPVGALENLQRSIELNDNRAVYRSTLMLDSDLAARSASRARVYTDLGFERLALVEGWNSVNQSPTSFSAHRFLADAYTGLPTLEAARASEFLQSQLWQPLNRNPIQPQLGQAHLGVIASAGPTLAGPNEFNPLFARDGVQVQGNLLVGGDNSVADDLAVSAVSGIYSLGLGQFHFETDGFRPNADQTQDIYNLFFQVAPSPRTSLQVELRHSETDFGDRFLRFDPDDFSEGLRYERESDSLRLGARYDFSPRSKLIVSLFGEDSRFTKQDTQQEPFAREFDGVADTESGSAELQHVFEGDRFDLISGLGYLKVEPDSTARIVQAGFPPAPATVIEIESAEDYEQSKAYLYSAFELTESLTLQAGASVFDCKNPFRDRSGVHPKIGLSWDLTAATRIRAAGFKTVRCVGSDPNEPALSLPQPESQTIEPTQIAGFNQVFDDATGAVSDNIGIALDHRFSNRLFAGVSFVSRELRVPYRGIDQTSEQADWGEDVGRLYLNGTIGRNWAVSIAYDYQRLDYGTDLVVFGASELTTQRVPLSLRYFSPAGWSAGITPTFVDQEIELFDTFTGDGDEDRESFFVVDAALVYRLPKRRGFVSLEAQNLFDETFRFQEPDPNVATIYPDRRFLVTVGLYFD